MSENDGSNNNGGQNPPAPNNQNNSGQLPDWARSEISNANSEAAAKRIEARDATAALAETKGQLQTANEEKTAAITRAETAESSLLKLRVALGAGVPGEQAAEFAELLQGSNEQELKDHADKIRRLGAGNAAPPRATDPSQGHGQQQSTPPVPNTPEAEFAQMWANLPMFRN